MDEYLREDYRGDEDLSDEEDAGLSSSSDEDEDEALQACNSHGKINIQKLMSRMAADKSEERTLQADHQEEDEELDDFEKDMRIEFESRAQDARSSFMPSSSNPSTSSKAEDGKATYDDIYFDSDNEEEEEKSYKTKKTHDELLYDPGEDDRDQAWVDSVRRSYSSPAKRGGSNPVRPLPNSDAVLNCPACFAVVCLDCQRHDVYKNQYRAMFVMNCSVDTSKGLSYTDTKRSIKKSKGLPKEELYNPVKCDACQTQLAVYDKEEIYHFFNVVSSHS